jgi:hypothetical protein
VYEALDNYANIVNNNGSAQQIAEAWKLVKEAMGRETEIKSLQGN